MTTIAPVRLPEVGRAITVTLRVGILPTAVMTYVGRVLATFHDTVLVEFPPPGVIAWTNGGRECVDWTWAPVADCYW